jgi:ABC-type transport system involved in multi-copper enzyme maturation permease subunit
VLLSFLSFELRYWIRGIMLWVFFVIVGVMFLGGTSSDNITIGGALENTNRNAPYVIQNYYAMAAFLTLLMTTAFVNSAAARDFAHNTWQLLFATPLRRRDFLIGRFLGSAAVSVIPILGVSAGVLLAPLMPWADADRFGRIDWNAHLQSLLVFGIPNTVFVAAIIFAVAALTRSTITSFIAALMLMVGYAVAEAFISDIRNETIAALADPFGIRAFSLITKYWTVADKNKLAVGWEGLLLWNRLLWLGVSAAIFASAYFRFSFTERASRRRRKLKVGPVPQISAPLTLVARPANPLVVAQFLGNAKHEFFTTVKSTSFIVILVASLLNTIPSLIFNATEGYGNQSLPVTYWVCDIIVGTMYLFLMGMVTYYAGVLVWKERDARIDEIHDALPHPGWITYAAKLAALLGIVFIILCLSILSGIAVQAFNSYTRFQVGLYIKSLLIIDFSLFFFFSILAFIIHVLSPNKYAGYFGYVVFMIGNAFVWIPLDVTSRLVRFGSRPGTTYSDMFHYAPYVKSWTWLTIYWLSFSVLLAIASVLLWPRGRETRLSTRWAVARQQFRGAWRAVTLAALLVFAATGAWAYYNTRVLNTVVTPKERERRQAEYEKTYKKYETLLQPRIQSVGYSIDVFPESRNIVMKGEQQIENKGWAAIPEIHFTVSNGYQTTIELDGATLSKDDTRLYYRIYKLAKPMLPGEVRTMKFTVRSNTRGF